MATIPAAFRQGDYVTWTETDAPEGASAIVCYLRTNAASGATISGVNTAAGWVFVIEAAATQLFTPGNWYAQFRATVDGNPVTYRQSLFAVERSLAYSGSAGAIDLRSQAEKDLEQVEAAIRLVSSSAQEYRIGVGDGARVVKRADLPALIAWRDRLKAEVRKEQEAIDIASGKGDPSKVYVRFLEAY